MATRQSDQASAPGSRAGSRMSEQRRERLMDIQKREQLKGMLVNKFRLKYGDKPNLSKYIAQEVAKYLKNDRLTEESLRQLDTKISHEANLRDKKEQILDDRRSGRSSQRPASVRGGSTKGAGVFDTQSVRSRSSAGSRRVAAADQMSQASSNRAPTEVYSEIAEEDQWAAIQKFNQLLHFEEQKQSIMREAERRRLIRNELDQQVIAKADRAHALKDEQAMYDRLMEEHVKLLGKRETEKKRQNLEKVMAEKDSRDRQLNEEKRKKKTEEKASFRQECEMVERLKAEMDAERHLQAQKRDQEREYLKKMLIENEISKRKASDDKARELANDVQAQEEHMRMLARQEEDRNKEFAARERRAQEFMNRLAGTVIKNQSTKMAEEEQNLARYQLEKEMRERMLEQRRMEQERQEKDQMRELLSRQMIEKNDRENKQKMHHDEQAQIWARDKSNYEEEERRLQGKITNINKENAQFLQRQIEEKERKQAQRKMNKQEFQFNKPLLREINQKRKEQ